jgi:hypothetical protein
MVDSKTLLKLIALLTKTLFEHFIVPFPSGVMKKALQALVLGPNFHLAQIEAVSLTFLSLQR